MSQFDQIVKNIDSESQKCNYNPQKDMNWDILPIEMRKECTKWMDFRTRTCLSATSKTEKSLVGSKKYKFAQVKLDFNSDPEEWTMDPYSEKFNRQIDPKFKKTKAFVSALSGRCEIENFCIKGDEYKYYNYELLIPTSLFKSVPFHFKRLSLFRNTNIYYFMKNCEKLEKVDFQGNNCECSFKLLLELPSAIKVKEYRFSNVRAHQMTEFLILLVQKWIDIDAEIGKSIQFVVKSKNTHNWFATIFANRIIEETDEKVRIRMNTANKQILFRKIGSRVEWQQIWHRPEEVTFEYISCKIIAIDLPKSEYKTGDGWIQAVYEKSLKTQGKLENPVEFDAEDQAIWGDECF